MRFATTITLILVQSALGLTYEIAAGRVLAPFFGTSLVTWTSVIAVILAGFSLGNALGGLAAERDRATALGMVRAALLATAVLMALSPAILGLIYAMGARGTGGMLLAVTLAFFPASVLVSFPSPLLAKLAVEARPGREGSSLGLVLAAGSVGAIAGAVLAGFVTLPLIGSVATFAGCGAAALLCLPLLRVRRAGPGDGSSNGPGDGAARGGGIGPGTVVAVAVGTVAVVGTMAGGPLCRHESGISCIDVQRRGDVTYLLSDRVQQAAERAAPADLLVLDYTRWLWARMARDLGPAPSVLFVGGGGYSLPTALLEARPQARATAVEIDPLITEAVRRHLPRAGAAIARAEAEGRLQIVHADGRMVLNETDRRFDAAVMDAFSSASVPAHLATLETYERLRAIVDGPVYVNLIDRPDGPLARGLHAILTQLYPHVAAVHGPPGPGGRTNVVLAASPRPLDALEALPPGYAPARIGPGRAFIDDRGWVGHR